MRRIAAWGLAGCVSALVMAGEPAAATELSAAQIVEKNVAARGGLEAWRNIQSMVWIGHIERKQAAAPNLPFMLEVKRPNKTRFEIKAQNQTALRIFDGTRGWKQRPTSSGMPEIQPYTAEELRFAGDSQGIDGPLVDYQAKGVTVALDGVEEVEGHNTYRLAVTLPTGVSHHVWIDAQSFLDVKYDRKSRNAAGQSGTISVFYRDYKTIDGLQIPLTIENGTDTAKATDRMVIDRVMLNPPLQDTDFAKPGTPGRSNAAASGSPRQAARAAGALRPRSFSGREAQ